MIGLQKTIAIGNGAGDVGNVVLELGGHVFDDAIGAVSVGATINGEGIGVGLWINADFTYKS